MRNVSVLSLGLVLMSSLALASVERVDYSYRCDGIGENQGKPATLSVGADEAGRAAASLQLAGGKEYSGHALRAKRRSEPNYRIQYSLRGSSSMMLEYQLQNGGRSMHGGRLGGYLALKAMEKGKITRALFSCTRKPKEEIQQDDDLSQFDNL